MTDVEDRLRHDLMIITERAQPGSIRPLRAAEPRRRSRTIRWLAPVAAMVAVIAIIAGVSLAGRSAGHRPAAAAAPAGLPAYYVMLQHAASGNATATVRQSATGTVLASVDIAHVAGNPLAGFWITAAANDRAFAIGGPFGVDILRLRPDGRVGRLTRLPNKISGYQISGAQLAQLSPDGSELALGTGATGSCSPCADGVTVIALATGTARTWVARSPVQVAASVVSWPGTGHQVFISYGDRYRLLNVAGTGGSLLADSGRSRCRPESTLTPSTAGALIRRC